MKKLLSLLGITGLIVTGISTPIILGNESNINKTTSNYNIENGIDLKDYAFSSLEIDSRYGVVSPESLVNSEIPRSVIEFFKEQQLEIKGQYFEVTNLRLVDGNKVPKYHDVNGARGAGQVRLTFDLSSTEEGNENGVFGSTTFFYTINYKYGDLEQYDGRAIAPVGGSFGGDNYIVGVSFMRELIGHAMFDEDNAETALWFAMREIQVTSVYLVDTGEILSQEVFDNMNANEKYAVKILVEPTEQGTEHGIINSAIFSSFFTRRVAE
ncbi:hypothetical protein [Spiroplasma endosymbiont of Othius punctulatus]|uniref:hypothetical protein n=1 Tax=Spiroplasma endosymbiont of Othius punctulatus TaxID=3066289 RepID=UPI0030CF510D